MCRAVWSGFTECLNPCAAGQEFAGLNLAHIQHIYLLVKLKVEKVGSCMIILTSPKHTKSNDSGAFGVASFNLVFPSLPFCLLPVTLLNKEHLDYYSLNIPTGNFLGFRFYLLNYFMDYHKRMCIHKTFVHIKKF